MEDLNKYEDLWVYTLNSENAQISLLHTVRCLIDINEYLEAETPKNITLQIDLMNLKNVNSEIIAQLVLMQSSLVKTDSTLKVINVNLAFKNIFDIVMFDRIIYIEYDGEIVDTTL